VTTTRIRLIAALAFVLPVAALVVSPATAAQSHKVTGEHSLVHQAKAKKKVQKVKARKHRAVKPAATQS
jgi:hypothetical protein